MNLNFPFIFPERIKHFSYQDTFKASYSSRHFYFSPVRQDTFLLQDTNTGV